MAGIFDTGIFDTGVFDHSAGVPAISGINTGSIGEQLVGAQIVATAGNGYVVAELVASEAADTLAASGAVQVAGPFVVSEVGNDTFAGSATATVSGSLAVSEVGSDTFAGTGDVEVYAVLSATEGAQDSATFAGTVQVVGALASTEQSDTIYVLGNVQVQGYEDASEFPDTIAGTGDVEVSGTFASQEEQDTFAGVATATISGALAVSETGDDTFAAQGVVEGGEAKVERRPRRLSVHGIADAKVFCRGGRSLTTVNSPTLVVFNPEFVEYSQHGWATLVSTSTTTHAGRVTVSCGGGSTATGGMAVTNTTLVGSAGEAVIPVLGRGAYKAAVTEDKTAVAYGKLHSSFSGTVASGSKGSSKISGSFSMSDAHFCRARGERRLQHTHTVAISALAAHGRFRRNVDTRTR